MYGQQENTLWTEAFRPDTLEGYIGNEHIIEKVKIFISKIKKRSTQKKIFN